MRLDTFEAARPVCPVCRTDAHASELAIKQAEVQQDDHIVEGQLTCSNHNCQREYPIIDGIPLIIRDLRSYLTHNLPNVCKRDDLSTSTESILGDCSGPSSAYNTTRQQLSSYIWDHYGDFDPHRRFEEPKPGSMQTVIDSAFGLADFKLAGKGIVLDVGCGVGRSTFELAQSLDRPVLGIDLHFPMLQVASRLTRDRTLTYSLRRLGMVYESRSFPVELPSANRVDFWACDATALPFEPETFSAAIGMNVIDCVHSPIEFLISLDSVLKIGASAIIASPYDWSESATAVESWLGGHSQRSEEHGASEPLMRRLLDHNGPNAVGRLQLIAEGNFPWTVRLHDRSVVTYSTHTLAIKKC